MNSDIILYITSGTALIVGIVSLLNSINSTKEIESKIDNVETDTEKTLQTIASNATADSAEMYKELRMVRSELFDEAEKRRRDKIACQDDMVLLREEIVKLIQGAWVLYGQLIEAKISPKFRPPELNKSFIVQRNIKEGNDG